MVALKAVSGSTLRANKTSGRMGCGCETKDIGASPRVRLTGDVRDLERRPAVVGPLQGFTQSFDPVVAPGTGRGDGLQSELGGQVKQREEKDPGKSGRSRHRQTGTLSTSAFGSLFSRFAQAPVLCLCTVHE